MANQAPVHEAPARKLYRSRENRMIAGVAGGMAEYIGIDPTIVRVAWVVAGLLMLPISAPLIVVLYFVLALIIPEVPAPQ